MWNAGGNDEFGALAQQYWRALSETMRTAGGASQPGRSPDNPWRTAMNHWTQLAGAGAQGDASDVTQRFSAQAQQWLGMMQQVAGQFAGRTASAEDITAAWKQAMGGGGNPFASLFSGMGGRGQSGFDQWYEQVAPMMGGMFGGLTGGRMPGSDLFGNLRQEAMQTLRMPAFGMQREQQERWQALVEAQLALQQANDGYNALLLEASRDAFDRFERKLAERSEPGRQLQSARALFDLWIDAAEEAYAEIALSPAFRKAYGELVNAQMRVRAGIQREVETICGLVGMPGRTEVDAAHRKIAELERQLRRLRDAIHDAAAPVSSGAKSSKSAAAPTEKSARNTPAAKKAVPKESAAKAAASKKTASKKVRRTGVAAAKTASGSAASKQTNAKARNPKRAAAKRSVGAGAKAKASRATASTPTKRAKKQAIATIEMPAPMKPMPAPTSAKRKR